MTRDGRRRQWLAVDVYYPSSKLALGLRERFGVNGVIVFDFFLRACKRNHVQGEMSYISEADFLNAIGLPGLALTNERGLSWSLDEFFTYLGQQKNTRRTRRGDITYVVSTRWERWENTRSRPRNIGPLPARNESGMSPDNDIDSDNDSDLDIDVMDAEDDLPIDDWVWTEFAARRFKMQPVGQIRHPTRWLQATERTAREEHWIRAQHLLRNFDISNSQLVDVLLTDPTSGGPQWLGSYRKKEIS